MRGIFLILLSAIAGSAQADPPNDFFADRPAFSRPEQAARQAATCDSVKAQLPDTVDPDARIDMAIVGPVTLIQTDGALWYLAVCSSPGVRVLCVTYNDNGLKIGDRAILRGGYARQDERHVLLDPCLASSASAIQP
jgi:hypothetical protein